MLSELSRVLRLNWRETASGSPLEDKLCLEICFESSAFSVQPSPRGQPAGQPPDRELKVTGMLLSLALEHSLQVPLFLHPVQQCIGNTYSHLSGADLSLALSLKIS